MGISGPPPNNGPHRAKAVYTETGKLPETARGNLMEKPPDSTTKGPRKKDNGGPTNARVFPPRPGVAWDLARPECSHGLPVKKVYSSENRLMVSHLQQVLEDHHIRCLTKNDYLIGGVGELPPNECWPELWVMEDNLADRAKTLVAQVLEADVVSLDAGGWCCPVCGENLEAQFNQCWNCATERPPGA